MYKKSPNDCHLLIKIDSKQKIKNRMTTKSYLIFTDLDGTLIDHKKLFIWDK